MLIDESNAEKMLRRLRRLDDTGGTAGSANEMSPGGCHAPGDIGNRINVRCVELVLRNRLEQTALPE